ncbi:MAG: prepilin-type N-terminal cleavage/methylation domain-containing protein [bacterium]
MIPRTRRGMTLLEVIVALTIAGIALAAGASVLGFLTDQQTRAIADSVARSASVRESLRQWIADAELGTAGDVRFVGARIVEPGRGSYSSLDFITNAPTPVAAGGDAHTRVRLMLTGDSKIVAVLSALPAGETIELPIADSVSAFDVRYRGSISREARWLDSWTSSSVLPAVAEVRIHAKADGLLALPLVILVGERR